jgi:sugar lactone lactonase YvrE
MVGTIVLSKSGGLILAAQNGFLRFDPETGATELIADPELDRPENRFNDGKCDPAGRLWAGTMPLTEDSATGALYCLHPDGRVEKKGGGYSIPNGIVWSADAKTMWHIDSPTRRIDAWDFDNATGTITNRRTAIKITDEGAFPDGMAIDAEGKLWVAQWGGWSVVRFGPETGEAMARIDLPVSQVTACAFGGPNLDELYITSARKNLSGENLKKQPLAGGLFKAKVAVRGMEPTMFAG